MLKLARRARGHFVTLIEIRVHLIRVKPGRISGPGSLLCRVPEKRIYFDFRVNYLHNREVKWPCN